MINVGVIGTGVMGAHHVRIYSGMENVRLVGIADMDRERVETLAVKYNTKAYTDFRELLQQDLDAVSISVPTTLHKEIALAAIESGASVLVEKPIADTVRNADIIIKKAKEKGVKLMVGHIERFNPAIMALKKCIDENKFGKIVSISATRVGPFEPRIRDVGIIQDLGVHDIDLMSYLYSEKVSEVYASAGSVVHEFEDYASIMLRFNNGNTGIIKTNWLTPHKVRKLTVTGTEGIAYVDNIQFSLQIYNGKPAVDVEIEKTEPLKNELEHFIDCVENDRVPLVSGEDGRGVLQTAICAIDSYKLGKAIEVGGDVKIYGREEITDVFKEGKTTVAVYGLGKMGLPLAAIFADKGARVIGADINEEVVTKINQGINPVKGEPGLDELVEKNVKNGRLTATTDLVKAAKDSDVMIILVPAFLDKDNKPDLGIVKSVSENIAKGLEMGDFVIVETTVPPGTTDNVVRAILEKSGLKAGEDFGIAHCPERTSSGRALEDILGAYPKVVGGINKKSTDTAEAIYRIINSKGVIPVSTSTSAETIKIAEGLYRDVNIALANELALISERYGIDVWEVIKTANTQPFCNIHKPGAGVGGHCIPVYPWFVINEETKLIKTAREVNDAMPAYVVNKVSKTLNNNGGCVKDSNVLVAGLVYRPGVKEIYHTPAKEVITKLRKLGANVYGYDSTLSENEMKSLMDVESPNGNKIDCAVFIHDDKYNPDVNADHTITLENMFEHEKMAELAITIENLADVLEALKMKVNLKNNNRLIREFRVLDNTHSTEFIGDLLQLEVSALC